MHVRQAPAALPSMAYSLRASDAVAVVDLVHARAQDLGDAHPLGQLSRQALQPGTQ